MMITEVGITEQGDPGLDFSWVDKLKPANIIITKNLNDTLIRHCVLNKDRIILHITCTGFGGTFLEPNVPPAEWTLAQVKKLIEAGFPIEQCVLRVDPIFPTDVGFIALSGVLTIFSSIGIKRCRFSFIDQYPHVKLRLAAANFNLPWTTFNVPQSAIDRTMSILGSFDYDYEACAEVVTQATGCISKKDLDLLGHSTNIVTKCPQRKACNCLNIKKELLSRRGQCPHGCLYCYWK